MNWQKALIIGTVQGIAILPGISRSGITISTAIFLGIEREYAAKFSFLISIPAILGAVALSWEDLLVLASMGNAQLAVHLTGAAIAAAVGMAAIFVLLKLVPRFNLFSWYCLPLGIMVVIAAKLF